MCTPALHCLKQLGEPPSQVRLTPRRREDGDWLGLTTPHDLSPFSCCRYPTVLSVCVRSITSTIRTLRVAYASQHLRVTGRPFVEGAGAAPPMFWATLDADG